MGAVLSPFGSSITIAEARVTSGNATCPNTGGTGWQVVQQAGGAGAFELDLTAAVGNRVSIVINGMRTASDAIDVAVIVGSSLVRYLASGTSTPSTDGDLGWYAGGGVFVSRSGERGFTTTAADLDGGRVRFVLVSNGNGTSTIEAATTDVFYWRATNYG